MPLKFNTLLNKLSLQKRDSSELRRILSELISDGKIIRKGKFYELANSNVTVSQEEVSSYITLTGNLKQVGNFLYVSPDTKGIKKDELLEAVETALLAAYKKNYGDKENAEIEINKETGDVKVISRKTVVEEVADPDYEISLEDAKEIRKRAKIGGVIDLEINAENFKRNAIQNAKQISEFMYIFKKSVEFEILTGGHAGPGRK